MKVEAALSELESLLPGPNFERCIRWPGDCGSHPDEAAIRSPRLDELVACVLGHLRRMTTRLTAVWSFWLMDGHPTTRCSGISRMCWPGWAVPKCSSAAVPTERTQAEPFRCSRRRPRSRFLGV